MQVKRLLCGMWRITRRLFLFILLGYLFILFKMPWLFYVYDPSEIKFRMEKYFEETEPSHNFTGCLFSRRG